jgi:hypothetical protein
MIKRKRPDRSEALKSRKSLQETVIKVALSGHLKDIRLYPTIQKWVSIASQTMNRGSLVFNRLLLYCLENQIQLPDLNDQTLYNQCFKVGVRTLKKNTGPIQHVWDTYFSAFPTHETMTGDGQMYTYTSKAYMTNFRNSIKFTFEVRQKLYIRTWLRQNQLDSIWYHPIRCAVNGWDCQTEPPVEALDFIQAQRLLLGSPDVSIDLLWIQSNLTTVLNYYYHILGYLEQIPDSKRFSLAPLHSIGSHALTIDTLILYYMLKSTGMLEGISLKEFTADRESYFRSVFDYRKLSKHQFSCLVQTDGVSIGFHFVRPKQVSGSSSSSDDVHLRENQRLIAIDPGRTNIMFGVERLSDDTLKTYKLTRKEYYFSTGMNRRKRKASKWQENIQAEEQTFSIYSPKTANGAQWDQFLGHYILVYQRLWEEKTGKKWAREKFRVFGLKKKVLDRFFHTMDGSEAPVVLFGASKFNPSGRHELSVPTTRVSKACSQRHRTIFVDEFNTTKRCSQCDSVLSPVSKRNEDGLIREIRGLRRCSSNVCAQASFKNRDLNAALNILRCLPGLQRPTHLSRGTINHIPVNWVLS